MLSQTRLMDLLLGQEHVGHKGDTAVETPGGFLYMQHHGQHSMSNFILVAGGPERSHRLVFDLRFGPRSRPTWGSDRWLLK